LPVIPFLPVQPEPGLLLQQQHIESNRREYGLQYDLLTFANPEQLIAANAERKDLLRWLGRHAAFGYADTKVDCNGLSPGCRSCGEGGWSCLFINGRCNGRCFYCPTSQDDDNGPPVTNGLAFASPEEYGAYVAVMGFSGVSISGDEPLLTPELTLAYLAAVRQRCGDSVHLWMYTNGTMLTATLCNRLLNAGLNEIRVDLGAVRYNPDGIFRPSQSHQRPSPWQRKMPPGNRPGRGARVSFVFLCIPAWSQGIRRGEERQGFCLREFSCNRKGLQSSKSIIKPQ
jgi:hypothetical protein